MYKEIKSIQVRGSVTAAKKSKIGDLVSFAKNDISNTYKEVNFGVIPNFQAQEINGYTGVFVRSATLVLNSSGIRHAFNGHSDNKQESARGQVGITDSDFELLPEILRSYDSVVKGNKNRKSQESVVFIKTINNRNYNVAMSKEQLKDSIQLIFNTMFIKK